MTGIGNNSYLLRVLNNVVMTVDVLKLDSDDTSKAASTDGIYEKSA
jgi:hypothetical protein